MPTSYTSLLGLALPVTGELSGTWGDTVNDYITQYLDASVAGTQTISGSQTAVTLSKTTATSLSQAGSGATGSSQYNIINCTGNPASMLTVTVPAASKTYVVVNATSTNQDVKIVGAGPTTGVTLVAGEKAVIAWNGSDFIKIATSTADGVTTLSFGSTGLTPSTATSGAVTVAGTLVAANGGTGQSSYTTGDLLYATGSTALSKLGIGTNGQVLTSTGTAPQWSTLSGVAVTTFSAGTTGFTPSSATSGAVTLAGTLATTNGGTGLTSFTANRVFYSSSTSAIGSSANLTFDGTTLTANALTTTSTVTINGGTANGVAYLNGSKVLTTGSALTFDGTTFVAPFTSLSGNGVVLTVDRTGTGGNDRTNVQFSNSGTVRGGIGTVGASDGIYFNYGTTEGMRLTSTGLGIGTSTVASKLAIAGFSSANITPDINITRSSSGTTIQSGPNITFADGTTNNTVTLQATQGRFGVWNYGAGSWIERLSVTSAGDVGIGTSSAVDGAKLSVYGNFAAFADGTYKGYVGRASDLATGGATSDLAVRAVNKLWLVAGASGANSAVLDSSGNLGLGVTPSAWFSSWKAFENGSGAWVYPNNITYWHLTQNAFLNTSAQWIYKNSYAASRYDQEQGSHKWFTAASGTAGNAISFTQAMTLDASGKLALNTTSASGRLTVYNSTAADFTSLANLENSSAITINSNQATSVVTFQGGSGGNPDKFIAVDNYGGTQFFSLGYQNGATRRNVIQFDQNDTIYFSTAGTERARFTSGGQFAVSSAGTAGAPVISKSDDLDTGIFFPAANELAFAVNGVEELRITSAGFTRPVAYADTVSALGNTGTATTINLQNANVFTATLTGNCTFTLSNAIATGSSSFTLILTNDGTAGRTVAWAGGSFVFPGGAASLSRTTTANAVDVWVFFTPNGGTTWYGNIAMKDMKA